MIKYYVIFLLLLQVNCISAQIQSDTLVDYEHVYYRMGWFDFQHICLPTDTVNKSKVFELYITLGCSYEYDNEPLPNKILQFSELRILSIDKFNITSIPSNIKKLKHLQVMYLWNCSFEKLPKSIGKLTELRAIDVRGSNISKLPKSILKLEKLEWIVLSKTKFKEFPVELFELPNLKEIWWFDNDPDIIPENIPENISIFTDKDR
ncbi:MAG: leucine-rich repeat domain-containing protein [Bernardetiaceae bacterium]|nr:leucine-rich repeat domain-containing protein [Bernardetiaceae bacterium]